MSDRHLPSMLLAAMSSMEDLQSGFSRVEGAEVDYSCGVVSSGRSVVFRGPDQRVIETVDLNTSALHTPSVMHQSLLIASNVL